MECNGCAVSLLIVDSRLLVLSVDSLFFLLQEKSHLVERVKETYSLPIIPAEERKTKDKKSGKSEKAKNENADMSPDVQKLLGEEISFFNVQFLILLLICFLVIFFLFWKRN